MASPFDDLPNVNTHPASSDPTLTNDFEKSAEDAMDPTRDTSFIRESTPAVPTQDRYVFGVRPYVDRINVHPFRFGILDVEAFINPDDTDEPDELDFG